VLSSAALIAGGQHRSFILCWENPLSSICCKLSVNFFLCSDKEFENLMRKEKRIFPFSRGDSRVSCFESDSDSDNDGGLDRTGQQQVQ
jgi:hypothetical protein